MAAPHFFAILHYFINNFFQIIIYFYILFNKWFFGSSGIPGIVTLEVFMNICVYGASSNDIDRSYIEETEYLGREIAKRGHTLVYGAGANGLMGAVARGVYEENGTIIGVTPSFFNVDGILFENVSELITTEAMRERKQIMEDKADAFIVTPGGIGTLEEFFEILTLKQLGRHGKAIVIFNQNGFYDHLLSMLKETSDKGFMTPATNEIYTVMDNSDEILDYLESYKTDIGRVFKF